MTVNGTRGLQQEADASAPCWCTIPQIMLTGQSAPYLEDDS